MYRSLSLLLCLVPVLAHGQEPVPVGTEFAVSTITTVDQGFSRAAADSDGNFTVVWEASGNLDGDAWGVFGRQFAADGAPLAGEFQVNTYVTSLQVYPNIVMAAEGDFVVAWQSADPAGNFDVFAQRFDSGANKVGGEIAVNTTTVNYQGNVDLAFGADGGFLVVWQHNSDALNADDIFGRLFDSAGNPVGGELVINTTTASDQHDPRVAATPSGFVVVWESLGQDGDREAVILQRLDTDAAPVGGEVQVNQFTTHDQEDPELAVAADGSFAVVWESQAQDGSFETAMGRIFNSDGMPRTDEFQINTTTTEDQEEVEVAPDLDGGFVAVWESTNQLGDGDFEDVFGRRFDSMGQGIGGEFQVNTTTLYNQDVPNLIATRTGEFLITWRGDAAICCAGVFGQRLAGPPIFSDGFESGDTTTWTLTSP